MLLLELLLLICLGSLTGDVALELFNELVLFYFILEILGGDGIAESLEFASESLFSFDLLSFFCVLHVSLSLRPLGKKSSSFGIESKTSKLITRHFEEILFFRYSKLTKTSSLRGNFKMLKFEN